MKNSTARHHILFLVPLPPPVHGSTVMSQQILDSRVIRSSFDCDFVNISTSRTMGEAGKMRLEDVKNIDRLISIYSKLPDDVRRENHFYIAGDGTKKDYLKSIVSKTGMQEFVHFLGNLPNEELVRTDSTKKILIMASSQEGLPTAIAEALSVGVPVVSTNPGDIPLVLKNNYNGYIFPLDFKDEDYVKAILRILNDYGRFAQAALESSSVFNGRKITEQVVEDIWKSLS